MDSKKSLTDLLKKHKVRKTPIRLRVLDIVQSTDHALTNHDIEIALDNEIDRVTLYRTLQTFIEHGIVHKIEDQNQSYYALCENCEIHRHHDNHVHFKCMNCEQIECIHQANHLSFSIPKNYTVKKMNVLLEGICEQCAN